MTLDEALKATSKHEVWILTRYYPEGEPDSRDFVVQTRALCRVCLTSWPCFYTTQGQGDSE